MDAPAGDDVAGFLLSKAYDVISDGNFKKHLIHCRDRGDAWAIAMHLQQARVVQAFKHLQGLIAEMAEVPQQREWALLCREVMASAQPPIKVFTGCSRCFLTGVELDYSIDLSRAGKNSREVYVDLRFWHFFVFLWYIAKIEYVVRSCTKQWLETADAADTTACCETFRCDNEELLRQLAALFLRANSYVRQSVELFKKQFSVKPVLEPPSNFFDESLASSPFNEIA